jgi:hypothetical protein
MTQLTPTAIEAEYRRLGHTLGWRFLTCPEGNISTASVALVTQNPGGAEFEAPKWSVEEGSAYEVERWRNKHYLPRCAPGQQNLQQQVKRMFQIMGVKPDKVLSGYFVPFRSQGWETLPKDKKPASIRFGIDLWRKVLAQTPVQTVIALGKNHCGTYMIDILGAKYHASYSAAWGEQTIDKYLFGSDQRLVVLPHLSRFGLFGRPQSEAAFRAAIA